MFKEGELVIIAENCEISFKSIFNLTDEEKEQKDIKYKTATYICPLENGGHLVTNHASWRQYDAILECKIEAKSVEKVIKIPDQVHNMTLSKKQIIALIEADLWSIQ